VEIARLDAGLEEIVRQVFGHLLRQRRDQHALSDLLATPDLVQQIVDLVVRRAQLNLRIDDTGRPDQLLGHARGMAPLERPRRRRDEHELRHLLEELVEAKRPVVERRRQPEPVIHECLLAGAVAFVHAADLRDGLVRLVDEDDEVLREVVEQREWVRSRSATLEDARVVLDPVAEAELLHHLEVVLRALAQPVRLEHLPFDLQPLDALFQLVPDFGNRPLDRRPATSRTRWPARSRCCRASRRSHP